MSFAPSGWPSAFFAFHLSSLRQDTPYLLFLSVSSPVQVCISLLVKKLRLFWLDVALVPPAIGRTSRKDISFMCAEFFLPPKASLSETVEEIGARMGIAFALSGALNLRTAIKLQLMTTYLRSRCTIL